MRRKRLLACTLLFVLLSVPLAVSVEAASMWDRTYGGEFSEEPYSLIETSDGGYAIAGNVLAAIWLVKTDAFGNMEWNRTYTGFMGGNSLVETFDGGYAIAGTTSSLTTWNTDFLLVKTYPNGDRQWTKTYGGESYDGASSLVATSDSGYAIAGSTRSFGAGQSDIWLVKTDASGNMEWSKTYGDTSNDSACSVVVTSDGGYAIAGTLNWDLRMGQLVAGDCCLVKTDALGNMEWNRTVGVAIVEWAESMVVTSDGGYAITGRSAGEWGDPWLMKIDSSGNKEWNQTYLATGIDPFIIAIYATTLVSTSDGGYALAGYAYWSNSSEHRDGYWLAKTDALGNIQWTQTNFENEIFGRDNYAWPLITTSDGGYALAACKKQNESTLFYSDFWLVKTNEFGVPEYTSLLVPMLVFTTTTFIIIKNKKRGKE